MTWHKPFNDVEIEYVKNHYPQMGCAAIAKKLGRSERGVRDLVKRLDLAAPHARANAGDDSDGCFPDAIAPTRPPDCAGEKQDELKELREIKRVLKRTLRDDIDPRAMPKLSAELREVIARIAYLEGDGDDPDGPVASAAGNLVVSVPLRPA